MAGSKNKDTLNTSLPLPVDSMPECWARDERMNALFAEFRNRSVNSQDWDSKYKFWEKLITDWLRWRRRCVFSIADLNVAFKRNGRTPLCLRTVVQELLRNGEITSETEFLKESSIGWTAWAIDAMLKRPLVWSFSKLKSYVVQDTIAVDTKFVHLKSLRDLENLIMATIDDESDNVLLPLSRVVEKCIQANSETTRSDIQLALIWLRRSGRATFRGDPGRKETLAKISPGGAEKVTEAEEGLYRLSEQEKMLVKGIEQLENERRALVARAKNALDRGMRELAKTCVRKKRDIDRSIEKRAAALNNVQTLIARIQDAHTNTEILAAYKTGGGILKNFESAGLNEETVTNAMDDVAEVVDELADLQGILSTSIGIADTDLELENELQELLDASKTDETETGEKIGLPDLADLPDLQAELSALNLQGLPVPPKTTLKTDASSASRQKDNPT